MAALPTPPVGDLPWLVRIEDAGLNASAPPQQRWMDGWLVRLSPGKAQRARCVNAVAEGLRATEDKLAQCEALFEQHGLPMMVRITPFTQPRDLDERLAARGYRLHEDTCVMACRAIDLARLTATPAAPGIDVGPVDSGSFAATVGALRGSTPQAIAAHAERLRTAPVPYRGFVLRAVDGPQPRVLACGQIAIEGDLVGLYDIATQGEHRRQGWGTWLCRHLLAQAAGLGARSAYLQVGADNAPARRIYARLGFTDAYHYHYRVR